MEFGVVYYSCASVGISSRYFQSFGKECQRTVGHRFRCCRSIIVILRVRRLSRHLDGYNLFHYFKRSIGYHRQVAILTLEGLVIDGYQCLRTQFFHIGDGGELEFFGGYGLSHPFFEADDGSNTDHGFFE